MRHDLDAYLRGASDLADLARAARVFDAGDLADARGLDALVWRALRDLAPLDAARVLLAALGRLDGELGASFRDGARVLAGLPAEWAHEDARAALHADRFDGALDVPDDADGPSLVLAYIIDGAYRGGPAIASDRGDRAGPAGDRRSCRPQRRSASAGSERSDDWRSRRPGAGSGGAVAEMAHRVISELAGMLEAGALVAIALDVAPAATPPTARRPLHSEADASAG